MEINKNITLPPDFRPFRFSGQAVQDFHASCLFFALTNMNGKKFYFRKVVFVLPKTPIPFLVGLHTARKLAFNLNFREGNGSHLYVTYWNAKFYLIINSHPWLQFKPLSRDPEEKTNWSTLITSVLKMTQTKANFCYPVLPYSRPTKILTPSERDGRASTLT